MKPVKVDWCGRKPDDPKPILYFSGVLGKKHAEKEIHERTKLRFRCISYHYLNIENRVKWATNYLATHGVRMFLDSGAFTIQKNPEINTIEAATPAIDAYVAYLKKKEVAWDWYAPIDYKRSAQAVAESVKAMHDRDLYPVPVFHGNDPLKEFERILDQGYPLVCIAQPQQSHKKVMLSGDPLRRYYQTIFNLAERYKVALHGFSQTGTMMFEFPWYSTDSTSWCAGSSRGQIFIIDLNRRKISAVYLGDTKTKDRLDWRSLSKNVRESFQEHIDKWGFTEKGLIESYMDRISFNILAMQEATLDASKAVTHSYKWGRLL